MVRAIIRTIARAIDRGDHRGPPGARSSGRGRGGCRRTARLRAAGLELPDQGAAAAYRLKTDLDLRLEVAVHHREESDVQPDIAFRAVQNMAVAAASRLEFLLDRAAVVPAVAGPETDGATAAEPAVEESGVHSTLGASGLADLAPNLAPRSSAVDAVPRCLGQAALRSHILTETLRLIPQDLARSAA